MVTNDELIKQYFTPDEAEEMYQEVAKEVEKIKQGIKHKNTDKQ